MVSCSTSDYGRARLAGVECYVELAFWSGTDEQHAAPFFDYLEQIVESETDHVERVAGIDYYTTVGLEPKEANYPEMAEAVTDDLPECLGREHVVGLDKVGLGQGTEAEEYAFRRQLRMAGERELPVIVYALHTQKPEGIERLVEMI